MESFSDSISEYLPAGMAPVRGAVGLVGGVVLYHVAWFNLYHQDFAYHTEFSPWQFYMTFVVGLVGIAATVWYVIGRPLYFRLRGSAAERETSFSPRFIRGMVLAVVGGACPLFVPGGARLGVQVLGILGAVLVVVAPLWYWFISAIEWPWRSWWPEALPTPSGRQAGLAWVSVLVAASIALTTVVALPVVSADETVTRDGGAVTITDVQRTQSDVGGPSTVRENESETVTAGEDTQLLVIEFTFENRAGEPREPRSCGYFCQETALACGDSLWQHCPEVTPHNTNNFTAGGREYDTYDSYVDLAPGEQYTSAVVYEVPRRSDGGERPQLTFIIYDIGRWDVSGYA